MHVCRRIKDTNQATRRLAWTLVKIHVVHLISAKHVCCDYTLNKYPTKCRKVNIIRCPVASQVWYTHRAWKKDHRVLSTKNRWNSGYIYDVVYLVYLAVGRTWVAEVMYIKNPPTWHPWHVMVVPQRHRSPAACQSLHLWRSQRKAFW